MRVSASSAPARTIAAALTMAAVLMLGGCGDGGGSSVASRDEPPGSASTTEPTVSESPTIGSSVPPGSTSSVDFTELLADPEPRYVDVAGFVVWEGSVAELCETLRESYPPQCGGRSLTIVDPVQLDADILWSEAQGVRWTDTAIAVGGFFDGCDLVLLEQPEETAMTFGPDGRPGLGSRIEGSAPSMRSRS